MKDFLDTLDAHCHTRLDPVTGLRIQARKLEDIGDSVAPPNKIISCCVEFKAFLGQLLTNGLEQRNLQRGRFLYLFHFEILYQKPPGLRISTTVGGIRVPGG
jgi:hypothetical protein